MDKLVLESFSNKLYELGKAYNFSKPIIYSGVHVSQIYILNKHAIQLDIDWRDYTLFMYIVRLQNGKLPSPNIIYNYENGRWCRKYLEEIYRVKRPMVKDKTLRYSEKYLNDVFDFYINIIIKNPIVFEEREEWKIKE